MYYLFNILNDLFKVIRVCDYFMLKKYIIFTFIYILIIIY